MLEELAKKDKYWRQTAFYICKDNNLAHDLVQEMYLKLADNKKQINDFYVILTIKNLFIDYCRKSRKEIYYNDLSFIDLTKEDYEPNEKDKLCLDLIKNNTKMQQDKILEKQKNKAKGQEKQMKTLQKQQELRKQ